MPDGMGGCLGPVQAGVLPVLKMPEKCIYVLRHKSSGLIKIGITENWQRRCSELRVSVKCEVLRAVFCESASLFEKQIHLEFDDFRLPQSEWFHLSGNQIQSVVNKISSLGEENKWMPTEKSKQTKRVKKQPLLLPEAQIDKWGDLLLSSKFVSQVDMYIDGINAYGLGVWQDGFDQLLSLKVVGCITPTVDGIIFRYLKSQTYWMSSEEVKCKDIFGLIQAIESHGESLLTNSSKLYLPVGTKIKTNVFDGKPDGFLRLHNELESYF